jgi:hypothetical protein
MANKRGRPARASRPLRVQINLRLWPGEDDDLIAFFTAIAPGQRAAALKIALRLGGLPAAQAADLPDDDLDDALDNLLF